MANGIVQSKRDENSQLRKENKKLKKELARKQKALAEAAVLLTVKKPPNALQGQQGSLTGKEDDSLPSLSTGTTQSTSILVSRLLLEPSVRVEPKASYPSGRQRSPPELRFFQ